MTQAVEGQIRTDLLRVFEAPDQLEKARLKAILRERPAVSAHHDQQAAPVDPVEDCSRVRGAG
jgi:hypothetical protein